MYNPMSAKLVDLFIKIVFTQGLLFFKGKNMQDIIQEIERRIETEMRMITLKPSTKQARIIKINAFKEIIDLINKKTT